MKRKINIIHHFLFLFLPIYFLGQVYLPSYQAVNNIPRFITSGLICQYELNNSSSYPGLGNTLYDLRGNVNATLYNSPTYNSAAAGYLQLSSGSSQYLVNGGFSSALLSNGTNFSQFLWVYPTANGVIISELGQPTINTGYHYVQMEYYNSYFKFGVYPYTFGVGQITASVSSPINNWYYVGVTYNSSSSLVTAYINGENVGTYSVNRIAPTTSYFGFGSYDTSNLVVGGYGNYRLGSYHLYNRALTPNEVLLNFNDTKSRYMVQPYKQLDIIKNYLVNYMSEFKNPSFYTYTLDGNEYVINDGGGDMYDGGNITSPWLKSSTTYTSNSGYNATIYPFAVSYNQTTTSLPVDDDFYYISLGYSTSNEPLTVIGSRSTTNQPVGWQVGGNSGADGGGTLASGVLYNGTVINGFTVYAFYREQYNAGDPSHCNLYILLGHPNWGSSFGSVNYFADPVSNGGCGGYYYAAATGTSNVLAIQTLLSKPGGALVTAAECQTVVNNFITRIKQAVSF